MTKKEAAEILKKHEAVKRGFEQHFIGPGFNAFLTSQYNSLEARDMRECPEKYTGQKKCVYCFNLKPTKKKEIKPGVKVFYCKGKADHLSNLKENKKPLDRNENDCPFFCKKDYAELLQEAEKTLKEI